MGGFFFVVDAVEVVAALAPSKCCGCDGSRGMGDTLEFRNDFRVAVAVAVAVLRRPGGAMLLPYVCRNGESSYLKYTVETITVIEMIQTLRQISMLNHQQEKKRIIHQHYDV
jgi:hypothetical protein